MIEEKKELNEFSELSKDLDRDRKLILFGIMKGMQIDATLNTPQCQCSGV